MDEHSFLDSSRLAVNLLMHNAELGWGPWDGQWWNCVGVLGRGP